MSDTNEAPGIGHNLPKGPPPPGESPPDANAGMDPLFDVKTRIEELIATANRWIAERPVIEDEEQAAKLKDFMDQLAAEAKHVEAARKTAKDPIIAAGKAVDARHNSIKELADTARSLLAPKMTAWLQAERDRKEAIARQERERAAEVERQAAEAAKAAAAADATVEEVVAAKEAEALAKEATKDANRAERDTAKTTGQFGGRATSLRKVRKVVIDDAVKVARRYKDNEDLLAVLARLVAAELRENPQAKIPGYHIDETERAV